MRKHSLTSLGHHYDRIKLKLVAPAYLTATGSSGTESRRARSGESHHRRSGLLLVNEATRDELLVIDGDVLGAGAAAVNDCNQDYVAFWGYVLSVCREVRGNGLVPVIPCTCLPEQLLSATTDKNLHLLTLLKDEHTIPARIEARTGGDQLSLVKHLEFDANKHGCLTAHAPVSGRDDSRRDWHNRALRLLDCCRDWGHTRARSRRPSAPGPAGMPPE